MSERFHVEILADGRYAVKSASGKVWAWVSNPVDAEQVRRDLDRQAAKGWV